MPILTFPALLPDSAQWQHRPNTQEFASDLNGVTQTAELPGDIWLAQLTFARRQGRSADLLRAFLVDLNGPTGRFWLTPHDRATPLGSALGSGVVSGAGQTGKTLTTRNWTPSQTELLAVGDYFQVGNELKVVTAPAVADGSGNATISFAPTLKVSPNDGASLITLNPSCLMQLVDADQAKWSASSPIIYALALDCKEALDL